MKVVALVPIKLNSQRLKNKNILDIGGKPLAWHIFNTLKNVESIDEIYVFCSDESIKEYIPKEINFLKRDPSLDNDEVKGEDIYTSFINEIDADLYVLAHTTSPFLKEVTISNAIDMMIRKGFDSAFSAKKEQTFVWYDNQTLNYKLNDIPRTQDINPIYIETSGFYAFKKDVWTKKNQRIGDNPFIQEVDIFEAIDIDENEDYELAKIISESRLEK